MTPHRRALKLARVHLGRRFVFYAAVSGVATLITQVVLAVLHGLVGWRASYANIAAVTVATPVSYFMNRAWVWKRRGKSHLGKEVAPFWAFSFAGLLLSTFLVYVVSHIQGLPAGQRPTALQQLAVNAANAVGFGILWLVQFFVLDKFSFAKNHHRDDDAHDDDQPSAVEPVEPVDPTAGPADGTYHDEVIK